MGASSGHKEPAANQPTPDSSLADLIAYERAGDAVCDALDRLESSHQDLMARRLHPWMAAQAIQRMYASTWIAFLCQTIGNELLEQASMIRVGIPAEIVDHAAACYMASADWSSIANHLAVDPETPFTRQLPAHLPFAALPDSPSAGYVLALVRSAEGIQERIGEAVINLGAFPQDENFEPALKVIRRQLLEANDDCSRASQMSRGASDVSPKMLKQITDLTIKAISGYFEIAQELSVPVLTGVSLVPKYNPSANAIPKPVAASVPTAPPPRPATAAPLYNPSAPPPVEKPASSGHRYDPDSDLVEPVSPPRHTSTAPQYDPGAPAPKQAGYTQPRRPRYDPSACATD